VRGVFFARHLRVQPAPARVPIPPPNVPRFVVWELGGSNRDPRPVVEVIF